MKFVVGGLVILLIVLHQDYWQWDNAELLFGFMPVSLAYHGGISIAAAIVWYMATRFCWPVDSDSESDVDNEAVA